jgi:hypothetical protein
VAYLVLAILGLLIAGLAFFCLKFWKSAQTLQARYGGITSIQDEIKTTKDKLNQAQKALREFEQKSKASENKLTQDFKQSESKYDSLKKELPLLEENLEDISFGLYKPHFSFKTSEEYKLALENLRNIERQLIRDGRAAICPTQWTVGDSAKEGQRMIKQYTKLMLRAFNGECDAALANVSWNNIERMLERIGKSCEAINQLGGVMHMSITQDYLKLKLDEIRLTYEYEEKRHREKEEQRRISEQIREEEKAQQEIEKARQLAEREEQDYEKALSKARAEALKATGSQLEKLTEQINSFESKLDQARQNKQRAIARAQLTKSGFVYVISNIGAFGERVFKIGMTRRMEPMDRVDELGSASVPFPFDLHVMLYSDNAPELETALHKLVQDRQVNLVNPRKEFYRDVELAEIEAFVKEKGLSAQFIKVAEAKEYRQTLALREQRNAAAAHA